MNIRPALFALAAILLATATLPAATEPEALARQQLDAIKQGAWSSYASAMHPKALARFKEMMMPMVEAMEAGDKSSSEQMRQALFGGKALDELKKASPQQFFEVFMGSMAKLPGMGDAMKGTSGEVLGRVMEGDKVAHVLVRTTVDVPGVVENFRKLEVISAEKEGEQWKGLLSGDMELQLAQMTQQMAQQNAAPAATPTPAASPSPSPVKKK